MKKRKNLAYVTVDKEARCGGALKLNILYKIHAQ